MDNWCSIILIVFAASYVVSQQLTSSSTIAPSIIDINTIGGSSSDAGAEGINNATTITSTTTTSTPFTVSSMATTTTAPSTTTITTPRQLPITVPTISTTTTASQPLILNGGDIDPLVNRDELAGLLIENNQNGDQYGDYQQQLQQKTSNYQLFPQFPLENNQPVYSDAELVERMNEKRSLNTGSYAGSTSVSAPTAIATYGSTVVNVPPVYGSTFGQPSAAKGIGYNVGYAAGQSATYGSGSGSQSGGGFLGGFGRILQMVGSGIKNLFSGGSFFGGNSSNGSNGQSTANDKVSTGKSLLSGVAQAGLGLKALGLGVGIGTLKGLVIGTKIGLIKGLILAKIKQSLQQQQQPQPPTPSYDYRHDTSAYDAGGHYGYGPSEDQTAYPKGDYDVGYGPEGQLGSYYDQPQYGAYAPQPQPQFQPQSMGPSSQFGHFPLGVVVGAVKGAKDGLVRGLFNTDILSKGQQLFSGGVGAGTGSSSISSSSSSSNVFSSDNTATQRQVFNPQ
ncbi:hypothetical protein CHUAL_000091 [Chamberlinius hualienensis]